MSRDSFYAAVVDDEKLVCDRLKNLLDKLGFITETFLTGSDFLTQFSKKKYNLIFLDQNLPDIHGLEVLSNINEHYNDIYVVMITGYGTIDSAVEAMRNSAFHYMTKPFSLKDIESTANIVKARLKEQAEQNLFEYKSEPGEDTVKSPLIGKSPSMRQIHEMIRKVGPVDCNVLLQGESGTGKELVARALHDGSGRKNKPFVSFNCAAFTEDLICSELFGHEKGAFTGAVSTKIGLLDSASGGTVFLDEIGEMPLSMQAKLLRAIQEKVILRVGGTKPIKIDIRIVAASNRDLKKASMNDEFREDLYYRLNVVTINLPRLVERKGDIPVLVDHFIKKYNNYFGKSVKSLSDNAMDIINKYHFPGNVRELENIIQRGVALADDEIIYVRDLPIDLQEFNFNIIEGEGLMSMDEVEKEHIIKVLQKTGGNRSMAAQILNIPRTTLWRKMKKYGMDV